MKGSMFTKVSLIAILILALTLVGCGGKKLVETDVPETDAPETDIPETDLPETDLPETGVPETDIPETGVPEKGVPDAYRMLAREINVSIGFDPSQNHHLSNFINYAKEYVWERIAHALYAGYNVSSAELLGIDVVSTGVAGHMEGVWTLELSYNINIWGEETDEVTGERVTFDGVISDETEGKVYLLVANYRKNANDVVMHKFITEAEINKLYGEDNPDKYIRAASAYMKESKNAYIPAREYTLEEVVWREMAEMYPTHAEWDYLKCYAYTMTASDVDEYGMLSVRVIAYEGEYSLVDGEIIENGGEYRDIYLSFTVDDTGYITINRSGGMVDEIEKDPALIEECRKKAEAHFANHMNSGETKDDLFDQFYNSKYTPEQWIEYNLYSDFGFREPVDVTALSDEELEEYMNDAYIAARDVFGLYEINAGGLYGRQGYSSEQEHVQIGEWHYVNMENPVFTTFDEWERYIRGIFGEAVADRLLSRHTYVEYEGGIYGLIGGRGTNIFWEETGREVTSRTDTEIVYRLTASYREEFKEESNATAYIQCHTFVYSLTEDGWRWTEFYLWN